MPLVRATNVLRDHVVKCAWAYSRVTLCVCCGLLGHPRPVEAPVHWLSCWDPRVCLMAENGIRSERQQFLVCCLWSWS